MSKKTKSETTTKKVQKTEAGGYNPETWTEEWLRKNEEAKKLKGVSRPVDILPICENDVTEADDHGENE